MTKDEIKKEIDELSGYEYYSFVSKKHEFIRLIEKAFYLKKRIEMNFTEKKYYQERSIIYDIEDFKVLKTVLVSEYDYNLECDYIKINSFRILNEEE